MKFAGASERSLIGIDLGRRSVAAVQVAARGDTWRIEAAAVLDRPQAAPGTPLAMPDGAEAQRLADVLYRQGFTGRRVALAVPDSRLLTAILELPPRSSGAPIDQLARLELARIHKREPASLELACWDVPPPARAGEGSHLMAAGCAHEDAEQVLDAFESAGFLVEALDARALAMARACRGVLAGAQNISALLDIGEAGALLAVVRGGTVVYDRQMPDCGVGTLRSRLCSALQIEPDVADYVIASLSGPANPDPAERRQGPPPPAGSSAILDEYIDSITTELRSALDYALHRYPGAADHILIMGPGAGIAGLAARVGAELSAPARTVRPAELAECPAPLLGPCGDPALTTALGLAAWSPRRAA